MKPVFPTYIIKRHARGAMSGKFFKALAIVTIPSLIVILLTAAFYFAVPQARDSLDMILRGNFENAEARMEYLQMVMNKYTWVINLFSLLFSFVSVGSYKLCIDMLRGKEVKIRNIFAFYDKWYVAMLYPLVTLVLSLVIGLADGAIMKSGINENVAFVLSLLISLVGTIISCKLIFTDYILADNNCTDFIGAVKQSWKMVGWNTIVNAVILSFSFIGWIFFSVFTMGLGLLFLVPYFALSVIALYDANVQYVENPGENDGEI